MRFLDMPVCYKIFATIIWTLLVIAVIQYTKEERALIHSDNEITPSAKTLGDILCRQDAPKVKSFTDVKDASDVTKDIIFQVIMEPIQSACHNLKRIGGQWLSRGFDGGKYVCFDQFLKSRDPCIIYSFGIGRDVSFEHAMINFGVVVSGEHCQDCHNLSAGCVIHGYDHTIPIEAKNRMERPSQNFFINRKGIAGDKSDNMTTFEKELTVNGHSKSKITYLKVDIEGGEEALFPLWIKSGVLDNVQQIGVEFHFLSGQKLPLYFGIMQDLYKIGFKIVSFDPNFNVGSTDGMMTCFEIVFFRVKTDCDFDK